MGYRKNITMEMTTDDVQNLLAEQNEEVNLILNKLRSEAIRLYHQQHSSFDIGSLNKIQFKEASVLLSLDDMNIRGQQIVDGYEWAQGNIGKLYEAIDNRNEELVQYINSRAAERYLNMDTLEDAIAVTGGASFKHSNIEKLDLIMDSSKAKEFLKNSIEKKTIDYSKLEITDKTTKEEGIKICEAHGFKLGFESDPVKDSIGQEVNNLLFTNDKGDILVARARDNNFPFGGCEIRGARDADTRFEGSFSKFQSNFYEQDDKYYLQFRTSYQDNNMFSLYDQYVAHDERLIPNENKEIGGTEGIPIPEFINDYTIEKEMPILKSSMESMYIADAINMLKLEDYISQMSEECRKIYEPIAEKSLDIAAENIAKRCLYPSVDIEKLIDAFPYIQEKTNLSKETMEDLLNTTYDKINAIDVEQYFYENVKSQKAYVLEFIEKNRDSLIEKFEEFDNSKLDQEQSFDDFLKNAHNQADKINQQAQDKMSTYSKEELERMVNSESLSDRFEAAKQGYGLKKLIHDKDPAVRAFAFEQLINNEPAIVHLEECNYNKEKLERMVNSERFSDRYEAARQGYGLEQLVNDEIYTVRCEVARQGYGLEQLVNDENCTVRCEVARQGYGLEQLVNDENCTVRCEVARQGYGLEQLVNDESPFVRCEVAHQRYGLEQLVNDEDLTVRCTAATIQRFSLENLSNEKDKQFEEDVDNFDDFLKDARDEADKINQQEQDKNISKDIDKEYER